jgi:hypothetical protein
MNRRNKNTVECKYKYPASLFIFTAFIKPAAVGAFPGSDLQHPGY